MYLSETKNWNLIKGESRRSQAVFGDSEYHTKPSHFAFAFITKNIFDLFNLLITLVDGSGNKITLPSDEIKVPATGFKIEIVK